MDFLNGTYSSLVALYTTSHPGRGFGLQFGMLGTLAAFFSVVVYVPRNRLKSLQFVGQKHHWLMLHMVSGLLCSFLVFVHATLVWSGIAGFANLAMWCSVVSGILVRYFSMRMQMTLNVPLLNTQENCANFWPKLHIYLSLAFGLFFGIHGLVVFLFKPLYSF